MEAIRNSYGVYKSAKFYIIVSLIGFGSVAVLPGIVLDMHSTGDALLLVLALFGATLPFFVWRERRATNKFFSWLATEIDNLENGAKHPDGFIVTWDTPLVRYEVVFSAILATTAFSSKPFIYNDRRSGIAQAVYTMYCVAFGWWFLGLEGVFSTIKAIRNNVGNKSVFTLRGLLNGAENA